MQKYGVIQDTEKVLQILTNAQFVEKKNQQSIRVNEDGGTDEGADIYTDEQGAQTWVRGNNSDDDQDQDNQLLDIEDKKILNKRKKRTAKIEDCYLDLDQFFRQKKRLRFTEMLHSQIDEEATQDNEKKFTEVIN